MATDVSTLYFAIDARRGAINEILSAVWGKPASDGASKEDEPDRPSMTVAEKLMAATARARARFETKDKAMRPVKQTPPKPPKVDKAPKVARR